MTQRTLQLFQLFLLVFAIYSLLKYTGNQRFLVCIACLIAAFLVGKLEAGLTEDGEEEGDKERGVERKDGLKDTSQALDWLLTSKRVVVLVDAVQHLFRDLGLEVSPAAGYTTIDRLVRIPGKRVTWGLKVLGDVEALNENLDGWEELASFDLDKGGKQRLLIIVNNCTEEGGNRRQEYKDFPASSKSLVSDSHLVAMSTRTLGKIYLACKEQKVDINTIFHSLQYHPGGVF